MITLYLTIFLISLIFFKRKPGVLACGLIGYCGGKPADPWKIRLLYLYNLKRGEHATGISIDKEIHKEVVPASKFLATNFELFENLVNAKDFTIIGHDRQASSGSKDKLELAHPHGIEEDGKMKFILAHNGTITNIQALATKYKIDHKYWDHSDSLTLAKIMASVSETESLEVLKAYVGTANLLFQTPRYRNTLFVHKDPERELFCYKESENSLYISSLIESLYAIGGTEDNIYEFDKYKVYKIVKGNIIKSWSTAERTPAVVEVERPVRNVSNPSFHKQTSMYQKDDLVRPKPQHENGFYCLDTIYYLNGHKHTGFMFVHLLTNEWSRNDLDGFSKLWFINGILMRDYESYIKLLEIACKGKPFESAQFEKEVYMSDVSDYSMFPVKSFVDVVRGMLFFAVNFHKKQYGKGALMEFTPYLSDRLYTITDSGMHVGEPKKIDAPKPNERKVVKKELSDIIREACKSESFEDIATLYTHTRIGARLSETENTYEEFCQQFIDLLEDDGVVTRTETMPVLDALIEGNVKVALDALNTLLELYNAFLKTGELSLEKELEELRKSSIIFNTEQFRRDVDQVTYNNLEDFVADYCPTDEDEDTIPFTQAVSLELNRLGILSDEEAMLIYRMSPGAAYKELCSKYEMYATIAVKETETTDGETFTDILAKKYLEAERLDNLKISKITDQEQVKLEKLKGEIADMLQETQAINIALLKDKYGIAINLIQEQYAGNETR